MVDTVKSGKEKMRQYFQELREKQNRPITRQPTQQSLAPQPVVVQQPQAQPQPIIVQQPAPQPQPIYTTPTANNNAPKAQFGFWRAISAFTVLIIMLVTVMWYMEGGLDYAVSNWSSVFDYIKSVIQSIVSSI